MEQKEFNPSFSFYPHLKEPRNYPMTLAELHTRICGESYQLLTQRYRAHLAQGEAAPAKAIKSALPCVMVSGQCPAMHNDRTIEKQSGLMIFDLDHLQPGVAEQLKAKAKVLPYVTACFTSISEGLKVVVRTVPYAWEHHKLLYAEIAAVLAIALQAELDMSSANPSRLAFLCHDPHAYYNPAALPFEWKAVEATPPPFLGGASNGTASNGTPSGAASEPTTDAPVVPLSGTGTAASALNEPDPTRPAGYIFHTVSQFFHYNPWVKGQRNNRLLALGRRLKSKGFSQEELTQTIAWVAQLYTEADCSERDIRTRMEAGFHYATAPPTAENSPSNLQPSPIEGVEGASSCEVTDDEEEANETIQKGAPFIPNEIFEKLPSLLGRILTMAHTLRERDMLLMATLANLSAAIPNVYFSYFNKRTTPHLYYISIAKAGSGKSVGSLPEQFLAKIDAHLERENQAQEKHYKQQLLQWEFEKRNAQKEGRLPSEEKEPQEPKHLLLSMPGNTSKNQLILALEANKPGLIINASESDLVSGAIHSDYGGHDVIFRQAYHNETVGSYFKTDKRMVRVTFPKLALNLAATPEQAIRFLPSQENGLASRMSLYFAVSDPLWISAAPKQGGKEVSEFLKELAEEVYQNYLYLLKQPTEVLFTAEQWRRHDAFFAQLLQEVAAEERSNTTALVLRTGLVVMRIAAILTTLRKCEPQWNVTDIYCTEEDFETALRIGETILHHNLLFSTLQPLSKERPKQMEGILRMKKIIGKMSTTFTYSEVERKAEKVGVSKSSVYRYLQKLIKQELLVKEEGLYRKTGKRWFQ
ncbi:MAG: DUF3987 domain-containing protein [Phocaeicola sp.]